MKLILIIGVAVISLLGFSFLMAISDFLEALFDVRV